MAHSLPIFFQCLLLSYLHELQNEKKKIVKKKQVSYFKQVCQRIIIFLHFHILFCKDFASEVTVEMQFNGKSGRRTVDPRLTAELQFCSTNQVAFAVANCSLYDMLYTLLCEIFIKKNKCPFLPIFTCTYTDSSCNCLGIQIKKNLWF